MTIQIITDSTCDLPASVVEELGIQVIPLHISQGDHTYLDGVDLSRSEFYDRLPSYDPGPQTAAPGPEAFEKAYTELARTGADAILSIHISERLSATVKSARLAAEHFSSAAVTVVDSGQVSAGMGFLVELAARLATAGRDVQSIVSTLNEAMKRTYVFASLETLKYLRRSGRMHSALASFGEILELKPLLHMHQGKAAAHRVRTQRRANERILEWLQEYAPYERLAVVHAGVDEKAEALRREASHYLPFESIPIFQITPVLGAHLGIGALGIACMSRKK